MTASLTFTIDNGDGVIDPSTPQTTDNTLYLIIAAGLTALVFIGFALRGRK